MRSKIVVAIAIVGLVIIIGVYTLYSFYLVPAWTVVTCPQYGCSPGGEQIIMEGYNFPVGGPLTVTIKNIGTAPVNLKNATYAVETLNDGGLQVPLIGGNCTTAVAAGDSCQAILSVSAFNPPLVPAQSYVFAVELPNQTFSSAFKYSVTYGASS